MRQRANSQFLKWMSWKQEKWVSEDLSDFDSDWARVTGLVGLYQKLSKEGQPVNQ